MKTKTVDIEVKGMTCPKCSGRVQKALQSVPGVLSAEVDHVSGKARVEIEDDGPDMQRLKESIRKAGYDA
ncbi:MAG: heavy-metal-associated domain-containing protein [Candidatus Methanomethylophilaceae archaeon]